jgi:SWI/SNF-related matrix-associated actin-dependent regulator of chromatin subfamily A member 5
MARLDVQEWYATRLRQMLDDELIGVLVGMNCILGDEMGLGKTLQTISLFANIRQHNKGDFISTTSFATAYSLVTLSASGAIEPHLIICPLSVLSSWLNELGRWCPTLRAARFHGSAAERTRLKNTLSTDTLDVLVTTYEAFVAEAGWLKKRRWTCLVLDEGHRVKNADTGIASSVQGVGAMFRLGEFFSV